VLESRTIAAMDGIKMKTIDYDSERVKKRVTDIMNYNEACHKHPLSVFIENPYRFVVEGWNGAPIGIGHGECARKEYKTGEKMELCVGIHAERRAISNAAKSGVPLKGGILYMSEWFPCADCTKSILQAGIEYIITPDELYSDKDNKILTERLRNKSYNFELSEKLIREAGIEVIVDPKIRVK
jgi:deoxycytidylate deaminase